MLKHACDSTRLRLCTLLPLNAYDYPRLRLYTPIALYAYDYTHLRLNTPAPIYAYDHTLLRRCSTLTTTHAYDQAYASYADMRLRLFRPTLFSRLVAHGGGDYKAG